MKTLSIAIPCYHSESTIVPTVRGVQRILGDRYKLEFVLVNDGSRDKTWDVIRNLSETDPTVKAINLTRNFGEHPAVMRALHFTTGDIVVIIDDDLQHPPEEIEQLISELERGYDVVYGTYTDKKDSWFRNLGSKFNHAIGNIVLKKPKHIYLSSFKVLRKGVVEQIRQFDSPFVFIDGLVFWITQNVSQVTVNHRERAVGTSNYNLRRLVSLHLNLLLGFSNFPLRLLFWSGLAISCASGTAGIYFTVEKLLNPQLDIGWTSLFVGPMFIGGVILFSLGTIGEYVGRIFILLNKKPQSLVKDERL